MRKTLSKNFSLIQNGYFEHTVYTKNQVNIIYAKSKSGEIVISKKALAEMYDFVGYSGYINGSMSDRAWRVNGAVSDILDAIFVNDFKTAQNSINNFEKAIV